jgi:hypothetical protein
MFKRSEFTIYHYVYFLCSYLYEHIRKNYSVQEEMFVLLFV